MYLPIKIYIVDSTNHSTHPSPQNKQIDSHLITFRLDFNIWFFLVTSCDDCTWRWNRLTNEVLVEISNFHINFTKIPLLHVPLLFPSSSKGCMLSSHWCRPSQALGPSTDGPKTYINQPFHFNSDFRFMNIEYRLFWAPVQGAWRHHRLSLSYRPPSVPWSTVDFPQDRHLAPCGELGEQKRRAI